MSSSPHQPTQASKRSRTKDVIQDNMAAEDQNRSKRRKFSQDEKGTAGLMISGASNEPPYDGNMPLNKQTAQSHMGIEQSPSTSTRWSLHHAFSGYISNIEPVFSPDENFIFLSLGGVVQVFSLSTSRPFRYLQMKDSSKILSLKLSPSRPEHLYVLTSSGTLVQWDWESSKQLAVWDKFQKTISFEICCVNFGRGMRVAAFSLREKKDGRRQISISPLDEVPSSNGFVVLETTKPISRLKVLQGGQVLIACDSQHVIIGTSSTGGGGLGDEPIYIWKELKLPVKITSLDVRENLISSESLPTRTSASADAPVTIDLALGESNGSILVYHDIVNTLQRSESMGGTEKKGLPLLRKLHWHREAVTSLCWSRDGNYVISGGKESVLVFWQLDSGRKQFLPHLSSPICSMAISPSGRLYAVKLADNSVVILSATELEQIATITGLQLPRWVHKMKDISSEGSQSPSHMIPALLHPQRPDSLLIAIPARQPVHEQSYSPGNLSVLQTFNIRTGSHVSRQALSRTNITVLNKGPEGAAIVSPDIQHLAMSRDGKWLATVDTWSPHRADVDALESFPLRNANGSQSYSEIFLKFWAWNDLTEVWELVTRIDAPHYRTVDGPVPLYCLSSRPDRHGFATLGADGVLRLWEPTARHHHSTKSRTQGNRPEQTWKCQTSIDLTASPGVEHGKSLTSASMSFSEDGSVLAICMQGVVHLIDTHRWEIRRTRSGLSLNDAFSVKFLERYVVLTSKKSTTIWDTVNDVLKSILTPGSASTSGSNESDAILSTVNSQTQSFAVVTRCSSQSDDDKSTKRRRKLSYHIEVYSLHSSVPLFQSALEYPPLCLLSDPTTGDYIIVDTAANVKRLSCHDENHQPSSASGNLSSNLKTGLENLFGSLGQGLSMPKHPSLEEEATMPQSRKLDGIFDRAPPFSLPPVSVLFKDVINSLVTAS
ncbi:hypothetical protein VTN77DRAFT_8583 [Rasamsonia byssochlamydoides]|uniref:uncharacterized protein n=1 Tax=Rasamsonia byssochlamydoides TaxID=89139 RepID=UPI003742F5E8